MSPRVSYRIRGTPPEATKCRPLRGLKREKITLAKEITIDKSLTINKADGKQITLDGDHKTRILNISASGKNISINNLTIQNGFADQGGGIYIQNNKSNVRIENSTISWNNAKQGAGIYYFNDNHNEYDCGSFSLNCSTINNNTATSNGGGVYIEYNNHYALPKFTNIVNNSTIYGNRANNGGGLFIKGHQNTALANTTICGNQANTGPGIFLTGFYWGRVGALNSIIAYNYKTDKSKYEDIYGKLDGYCNISSADFSGDGNIGNIKYNYNKPEPLFARPGAPKDGDFYIPKLADNGGPTQTVKLDTYSIAIGAGTKTKYLSYYHPGEIDGLEYYHYSYARWLLFIGHGTSTEIITDQRGRSRSSTNPTVGAYSVLDFPPANLKTGL